MKKQLFKNILIFSIIILLTSCSEELYEEELDASKNKTSIKEMKFDKLFKDKKFNTLLNKVTNYKAGNNSNTARSTFENQNGFTISNEIVKIITYDSLTSYTMLVERDSLNSQSTGFENLVIQETNLGDNVKAFLIKYMPNQIIPTTHNSFTFEGTIQKSKLAFTGFNRGASENTIQSDCYVDVLMCNESWSGGVAGTSHVAGEGCKNIRFLSVRKVKVLCADGSVGGGGDSGGDSSGDSGGFGDPYGGGGAGGGTGSSDPNDSEAEEDVITSPVTPSLDGEIPGEKTPCEELINKDQDSIFNVKMEELKLKAGNQNFESAYALYQNAIEGFIVGNEFTGDPNGVEGGREVTLTLNSSVLAVPGNCIGFTHCHLDDGTTFKVFSFSDIFALAQLVNVSTRPANEYSIYVTTNSGTFALKVSNKILLKNKKDFMEIGWKEFEKEFKKNVKIEDSYDKQKLGFMKFMNNMPLAVGNPGIEMYEKVNGTWNKLALSSNGNSITSTPCN